MGTCPEETSDADVLRTVTVFVIEMVGGLRRSGTTAARWGKWGKTTSQPVAIPLLALATMVTIAGKIPLLGLTVTLVIEVMRRLRVSATIAGRRRLGNIPLTMRLVIEVMRRLRGSATIAGRRRIGNIPLLRLTMSLEIEMVRGLRVSATIAARRRLGNIPLTM
jgi:hypothetical protein